MIQSLIAGFFALVVLLSGFAAGAFAADDGHNRMGYDYSIFAIDAGGPQACEQACQQDARCKAWTFIKPVSQCRLKYDVGQDTINGCCVAGLKKAYIPSADRDEAQCADMALTALKRQELNLQYQCGYQGAGWTMDYRAYFDRCLESSPPRRALELADQKSAIEDCRAQVTKSVTIACDHYARFSFQQLQTNSKIRCGFKGEEWQGTPPELQQWCASVPPNVAQGRQDKRELALAKCFVNYGRPPEPVVDQDCANYAKKSVEQYQQALDQNCGRDLGGPFWNADYGGHYRWCLKNKDQVAHYTKERRHALDFCALVGGGVKLFFKF